MLNVLKAVFFLSTNDASYREISNLNEVLKEKSPFLNRFEKHVISSEYISSPELIKVAKELSSADVTKFISGFNSNKEKLQNSVEETINSINDIKTQSTEDSFIKYFGLINQAENDFIKSEGTSKNYSKLKAFSLINFHMVKMYEEIDKITKKANENIDELIKELGMEEKEEEGGDAEGEDIKEGEL